MGVAKSQGNGDAEGLRMIGSGRGREEDDLEAYWGFGGLA